MSKASTNQLAERVRSAVLSTFPDWNRFVEEQVDGDIQIEVPAPIGSKAGSLVTFTARGEDVWGRFSPAHMVYAVDDETELVDVMKQLVSKRAVFAVILDDGQWTETTLLSQVVSWSGAYDREIA